MNRLSSVSRRLLSRREKANFLRKQKTISKYHQNSEPENPQKEIFSLITTPRIVSPTFTIVVANSKASFSLIGFISRLIENMYKRLEATISSFCLNELSSETNYNIGSFEVSRNYVRQIIIQHLLNNGYVWNAFAFTLSNKLFNSTHSILKWSNELPSLKNILVRVEAVMLSNVRVLLERMIYSGGKLLESEAIAAVGTFDLDLAKVNNLVKITQSRSSRIVEFASPDIAHLVCLHM